MKIFDFHIMLNAIKFNDKLILGNKKVNKNKVVSFKEGRIYNYFILAKEGYFILS